MTIIGLVGPFGSGCSYISSIIMDMYDFERISLSSILRDLYKEHSDDPNPSRKTLQEFGDEMRRINGPDYLSTIAWKRIDQDKNYIIDSIRNPEEINYIKERCSNIYIIGVFAEQEIRFNRVREKYNDNLTAFKDDDERDSGESMAFGQQVTACFKTADIIILNNKDVLIGSEDYDFLLHKIKQYIDVILKTLQFYPSPDETYMTMAYAVSFRSSCLKRKVGALIIDDLGNIISSGYNEVPIAERSCKKEYGRCNRDRLKSEFSNEINRIITDPDMHERVYTAFKNSFKILDYCKALHAEENAIINVARTGSSEALKKSIIYSTTYPCKLCANKIAQVGIREVVYFEPYPMADAKDILTNRGIKQTPFEGATYNGYFKFMEGIE